MCACVSACVCVCIFCIVMLEPLSTLCVFFFLSNNIFHLNVHYVRYTMLVQHFEPQGRRFTNFHYYCVHVPSVCRYGRE